jgi:signal transduction histidine kinase
VENTQEKKVKLPNANFVRKKTLQASLQEVSQQMYTRNKELAETNKTLSLLRTIDGLVLDSHASIKIVCERITQAITQATGYGFVGLMTRSSHTREEVALYGWSAGGEAVGSEHAELFARPVHLNLDHEWFASPETSRMISLEGLPMDEAAHLLNVETREVRKVIRKLSIKTVYIVKLQTRQRVVGLLVVGFYNPIGQVPESETLLINRISDSIGVALENKLLFEENQYVLKQLKESNAKLKALDEAKDDFISMASHQLRTPLTSIKGYLSMVMEGDAGEINDTQKNMLGQAFFSSQRMVYLIADLLNVSRLRTGKFIIEPAPVNLATVVQEELGQLKETAKSRGLTLTYEKPKDFPDIMLDETKTRQVIMNFCDNAIYYTPAGGKINVKVIDNKTTIELRVEDNGIGVPKSEQPHLFTKFYRAGNARKARPDGTGLGLFMAKKVIIAQGGALVFESKEGKGSTFGFIFSKSKLAVPKDWAPKPVAGAVREPAEKPATPEKVPK